MDKRKFPKTERHLYKQSDFDYDAFGLAVKAERVKNRMNQDELAKLSGCVRSTISKCERGMAVNPATMIMICLRFKLNILDYCVYEK